MPATSGFPQTSTPGGIVLVLRPRTKRNRALQDLFANCTTSGETSPESHKSHRAEVLQSGTNFQTRIISQLCGREGLPLTSYWRERLSPRPTASQGDCQAAEAWAAQPAPWSGPWGGTARIARCQVPRGSMQWAVKASGRGQFLSAALQLSRSVSHSLSPPLLSSLSLPWAPTPCAE